MAVWPSLMSARSLSTTSVVTSYVVEAIDDGRARRGVEAGRMLTSVTRPAIGAVSVAGLDLPLDRRRVPRTPGRPRSGRCTGRAWAWRSASVSSVVLGVLEVLLGDREVDVRGAQVGRGVREIALEVGGVGRGQDVARGDACRRPSRRPSVTGHVPVGLPGASSSVDEVRVGAEQAGRRTRTRRACRWRPRRR